MAWKREAERGRGADIARGGSCGHSETLISIANGLRAGPSRSQHSELRGVRFDFPAVLVEIVEILMTAVLLNRL